MKLIPIDPAKPAIMTRPCISISTDRGVVRLSSSATKELNLTKEHCVRAFQDADNPGDWYLHFSGNTGCRLRGKGGKNGSQLTFTNRSFVDAISKLVAPKKATYRLAIATEAITEEGVAYYAILTRTYDQLNPQK